MKFLRFLILYFSFMPITKASVAESKITFLATPSVKQTSPGGQFTVEVKITNLGTGSYEYQSWICSHWKVWKFTSPHVRIDRGKYPGCLQNFQIKAKIEPGKSFEKRIPLLVDQETSPQTLSFKIQLGENPQVESNPISILVKSP
jgi:hypothetical protein